MESDRAQNFHDRLNQWVASQGFWFQLRYSLSGKGMGGSGFYHFLRLTARVLMFLSVIGVIGVVYLIKRADTDSFRDGLQGKIVREAGAKEGKIEGFQRSQGKIFMTRFAATGNEGTFFTDVDLRDVTAKMGILDGILRQWKAGVISAARMDMHLRAGTAGSESAATLGDVLFKERQGVEIQGLDVEDATLGWGYSDLNSGLIQGTQLKARNRGSSWWIQCKGGTFSQNWLRGLEIVEIEAICDGEGLRFEKGVFKKGTGTLELAGVTVKGKERPEISGVLKLKNLPFDGFIPDVADALVEGMVSGALNVSGSTNSQEGISFAGDIQLQEGDVVMLRDRLPLLRSLRGVDVFNNYRRVNFSKGSLHLKTGERKLEITDVDLHADDLMTLKGGMLIRPPTKQEREQSGAALEQAAALGAGDENAEKAVDFTLKRAGTESRKKGDGAQNGVLDRYEVRQEERKFAEKMATALAEQLRYEGMFEVTLRPDAFDQSPPLKAEYQTDEGTGRIHLKVPVEGTLGTVTLRQAEELSEKAKR